MKCYHCNGDHPRVDDVRQCATGIMPVNRANPQTVAPDAPTVRQLQFIDALAYKKGLKGQLKPANSRSQASKLITYLKRQPDVSNPLLPRPIINFAIVNMIKPGRYAVIVDIENNDEYIFFRVSRPEKGNDAGTFKVQTQHGEYFTTRLKYDANNNLIIQNSRPIRGYSLAELITLIVLDQRKAALDYGEKAKVCCCCGRNLTDDRSRHYRIGPECEKDWLDYIAYVDDAKGPYVKSRKKVDA